MINSPEELLNLIGLVSSPATNAADRSEAEKRVMQIQRAKDSWKYFLLLLPDATDNLVFYIAQGLNFALSRYWVSFSAEEQQQFHQSIISTLRTRHHLSPFAKKKIQQLISCMCINCCSIEPLKALLEGSDSDLQICDLFLGTSHIVIEDIFTSNESTLVVISSEQKKELTNAIQQSASIFMDVAINGCTYASRNRDAATPTFLSTTLDLIKAVVVHIPVGNHLSQALFLLLTNLSKRHDAVAVVAVNILVELTRKNYIPSGSVGGSNVDEAKSLLMSLFSNQVVLLQEHRARAVSTHPSKTIKAHALEMLNVVFDFIQVFIECGHLLRCCKPTNIPIEQSWSDTGTLFIQQLYLSSLVNTSNALLHKVVSIWVLLLSAMDGQDPASSAHHPYYNLSCLWQQYLFESPTTLSFAQSATGTPGDGSSGLIYRVVTYSLHTYNALMMEDFYDLVEEGISIVPIENTRMLKSLENIAFCSGGNVTIDGTSSNKHDAEFSNVNLELQRSAFQLFSIVFISYQAFPECAAALQQLQQGITAAFQQLAVPILQVRDINGVTDLIQSQTIDMAFLLPMLSMLIPNQLELISKLLELLPMTHSYYRFGKAFQYLMIKLCQMTVCVVGMLPVNTTETSLVQLAMALLDNLFNGMHSIYSDIGRSSTQKDGKKAALIMLVTMAATLYECTYSLHSRISPQGWAGIVAHCSGQMSQWMDRFDQLMYTSFATSLSPGIAHLPYQIHAITYMCAVVLNPQFEEYFQQQMQEVGQSIISCTDTLVQSSTILPPEQISSMEFWANRLCCYLHSVDSVLLQQSSAPLQDRTRLCNTLFTQQWLQSLAFLSRQCVAMLNCLINRPCQQYTSLYTVFLTINTILMQLAGSLFNCLGKKQLGTSYVPWELLQYASSVFCAASTADPASSCIHVMCRPAVYGSAIGGIRLCEAVLMLLTTVVSSTSSSSALVADMTATTMQLLTIFSTLFGTDPLVRTEILSSVLSTGWCVVKCFWQSSPSEISNNVQQVPPHSGLIGSLVNSQKHLGAGLTVKPMVVLLFQLFNSCLMEPQISPSDVLVSLEGIRKMAIEKMLFKVKWVQDECRESVIQATLGCLLLRNHALYSDLIAEVLGLVLVQSPEELSSILSYLSNHIVNFCGRYGCEVEANLLLTSYYNSSMNLATSTNRSVDVSKLVMLVLLPMSVSCAASSAP